MSARSLQAMRATGYAAMRIIVKLMSSMHASRMHACNTFSFAPDPVSLTRSGHKSSHLLVPHSTTSLTADAIDALLSQSAIDPAIIGKFALVRRGTCRFTEKAINVLAAGKYCIFSMYTAAHHK